jgi:molybdopterin converting factor small subunit
MSVLLAVAALYALGTFAYFAARKMSYHKGKAEVYQEFADTFSALGQWSFARDKDRKKAAQKRAWMRLVMCDPTMADALRDALKDGDEHWKRAEVA